MASLVNGIASDQISVFDRGLLYGQSVFETIAVDQYTPLLLNGHMRRLRQGCEALSIRLDEASLLEEIDQLCSSIERGVLRVTITMGEGKRGGGGEGGRGYANPPEASSNRIISTHAYPQFPADYYSDGVVLGLSEFRLSSQPALAGIKHGNRLEQVLARSTWQSDWQEALLLDQQDNVIEATQSNIFIRRDEQLLTPSLQYAGVAGVMREFVLQNADKVGVSAKAVPLSVADVESADEVFLSNSVIGLWPVQQFKNTRFTDFSISHKFLDVMQPYGAIPTL